MKYDLLPENAKATLLEYFEGNIPRRLKRWGYAEVPLGDIVKEMWRTSPAMRADFNSSLDYHRWYISEYGRPDWAKKDPDSVWAILLSGPVGGPYEPGDYGKIDVVEDGFHRLHYYWDRYGLRFMVPVVWALLKS